MRPVTARLTLAALVFVLPNLASQAIVQSPAASTPSAVPAFPLAPAPGPQIYPAPLNDSNDGFVSIFNGTSLDGWDGEPRDWRVEDQEIVGEVTPATLLKQNNFLIWRGGAPANFELKAEFRIRAQGNSGINYRSVEIPATKWLMRGYQADDDDPEHRKMSGLIGVQVHVGPPMKIEYRTFLLKTLPSE
jgi:hypothetical protein